MQGLSMCQRPFSLSSESTVGDYVPHIVYIASHQLIVENRLVQMAAGRT